MHSLILGTVTISLLLITMIFTIMNYTHKVRLIEKAYDIPWVTHGSCVYNTTSGITTIKLTLHNKGIDLKRVNTTIIYGETISPMIVPFTCIPKSCIIGSGFTTIIFNINMYIPEDEQINIQMYDKYNHIIISTTNPPCTNTT